MVTDPYSMIHDALWTVLEASAEFTALVAVGNRIKCSGTDRNPIDGKALLQSGDVPEVRITMRPMDARRYGYSSGEADALQFAIEVTSGDQRLTSSLLPLLWAIRRALFTADATLRSLVFNSRTGWVVQTEIGAADIGVSEADLNRGIRGWTAVWSITAVAWFNKSDLTIT